MYRSSLRDLLGTLLDTFAYHPYADRLRPTRLKIAWWRRFDRRRYETLRRLNLGCGPNILEGFCNVDVVGPADLHFNFLNRFPLPDGTSDLVYCEHTLEHFHIDHVRHIVKEIHRVLRPGGVARFSVPKVFAPGASDPRVWAVDELEGDALVELNRRIFGHEHKAIYSANLFQALCREAGFEESAAVREQESRFADPTTIRAIEHRRTGNVVVEARKSA